MSYLHHLHLGFISMGNMGEHEYEDLSLNEIFGVKNADNQY